MAGPDQMPGDPVAPGLEPLETPFHARTALRVLVVDNDIRFTVMLRSLLEVDGHRVVLAYDPREAVAMVEREMLDVAIVDLSMPVMNGWKLAEQLRLRRPKLAIVLCTGWGVCSDEASHRDQVDAILAKPFRLHDLRSALERAIAATDRRRATVIVDRDRPPS